MVFYGMGMQKPQTFTTSFLQHEGEISKWFPFPNSMPSFILVESGVSSWYNPSVSTCTKHEKHAKENIFNSLIIYF